jgi:hypothetical protein
MASDEAPKRVGYDDGTAIFGRYTRLVAWQSFKILDEFSTEEVRGQSPIVTIVVYPQFPSPCVFGCSESLEQPPSNIYRANMSQHAAWDDPLFFCLFVFRVQSKL